MLRLFNDYHDGPFGLGNQSESTRNAMVLIAGIVRAEIAQDRTLIWC